MATVCEAAHQKLAEVGHVRVEILGFQHFLNPLANRGTTQASATGEQLHVGTFEGADILMTVAAALKPHAVDHAHFGAISTSGHNDHKRGDVRGDACHPADKGVLAHRNEMVNGRVAADVDVLHKIESRV